MRKPVVAGKFYAGTETKLREQVEWCFRHKVGPGKLPQVAEKRKGEVRGIVVPHAGFMYSGPVAAHSYYAIATDGVPETFVVIGPNHTGYGTGIALAMDDFETPFGKAEVNRDLARKMVKGLLDEDISAHSYEHSIEVQLPFIKYLAPKARIVPVCMMMQDYEAAKSAGEVIRDALRGEDVVMVASSDFSHYVTQEDAKRLDSMAIECITSCDPKALYHTVTKHNISMCGYGPVMTTMEALQPKSVKLLKYATSGDLAPMREVVGYAALAMG